MKLDNKFKVLRENLKQEKFLKGPRNDLSYYIFDYNPKDEIEVRYHVKNILKDFNRLNPNKIIEFDLYKMFIEFLKEQDIFEQIQEMEESDGKEFTLNAITPFISEEMYIDKIKNEASNYEVVFITGVGKIYPFMRSHFILNKLHSVLGKKTLVMFYPGQYTGQDLTLFNKIVDDNYYRAFPIVD